MDNRSLVSALLLTSSLLVAACGGDADPGVTESGDATGASDATGSSDATAGSDTSGGSDATAGTTGTAGSDSDSDSSDTAFEECVPGVIGEGDGGLLVERTFDALREAMGAETTEIHVYDVNGEGDDFYLSGQAGPQGMTGFAWLARVDADGGLVWLERFEPLDDATASALARHPDGGVVVAGQVRDYDATPNQLAWFASYGPDGATRWSEIRPFLGGGEHLAVDDAGASTGLLWLNGGSDSTWQAHGVGADGHDGGRSAEQPYFPSGVASYGGALYVLDGAASAGSDFRVTRWTGDEQLAAWSLHSMDYPARPTQLGVLCEHEAVLVGQELGTDGHASLTRVDLSTGAQRWSELYDPSELYDEVREVRVDSVGAVVLLVGGSDWDAYLAKWSRDGALQWSHEVPHWFQELAILEDDSVVIAGVFKDGPVDTPTLRRYAP